MRHHSVPEWHLSPWVLTITYNVLNPPVYENGVRLDGFRREDCEEDSEEHNEADSVDEHE